MKFRFSPKVTFICLGLILSMLRLSYWQWEKHLIKIQEIATLQKRIDLPVTDISEILNKKTDYESLAYRRLKIEGDYDFEHEITLRNRRYEKTPGVHVITPLRIKNSESVLFVSRGFIPNGWTERDKRSIFQKEKSASFIGLVKESQIQKFLAPADPETGPGLPWADAWLRVDLNKIEKQLPYKILPFYVEVMTNDDTADTTAKIIASKSSRDEMFFLSGTSVIPEKLKESDLSKFPVPAYDTIVSPGRHLGYVYEWAIMALITFLICIILQLRRPTN